MNLLSHLMALALAVSYLVVGAVSQTFARDLWLPYAVLTLFFAVVNITLEHKHGRARR